MISQDMILDKNIILVVPTGLGILNSWICLYRMFHFVSLNQTQSQKSY